MDSMFHSTEVEKFNSEWQLKAGFKTSNPNANNENVQPHRRNKRRLDDDTLQVPQDKEEETQSSEGVKRMRKRFRPPMDQQRKSGRKPQQKLQHKSINESSVKHKMRNSGLKTSTNKRQTKLSFKSHIGSTAMANAVVLELGNKPN